MDGVRVLAKADGIHLDLEVVGVVGTGEGWDELDFGRVEVGRDGERGLQLIVAS